MKAVEQSINFMEYVKRRIEENYDIIDATGRNGDVHKTIEILRKIFLKGY